MFLALVPLGHVVNVADSQPSFFASSSAFDNVIC